MQIRELTVPDSYEITPLIRSDDRGVFFESYRFDRLEEKIGHPLTLRQANTSVSKKGVVRGIHYADVPLGQAKYVTCLRGAVLDYVVDIRVGSSTFGKWDSVRLDDVDFKSIYLSEGLGHAFVALTENAIVSYLVSDVYNPNRERGINPLDPSIGLAFPPEAGNLIISPRDVEAPTMADSQLSNVLPSFDATHEFYELLRSKER